MRRIVLKSRGSDQDFFGQIRIQFFGQIRTKFLAIFGLSFWPDSEPVFGHIFGASFWPDSDPVFLPDSDPVFGHIRIQFFARFGSIFFGPIRIQFFTIFGSSVRPYSDQIFFLTRFISNICSGLIRSQFLARFKSSFWPDLNPVFFCQIRIQARFGSSVWPNLDPVFDHIRIQYLAGFGSRALYKERREFSISIRSNYFFR